MPVNDPYSLNPLQVPGVVSSSAPGSVGGPAGPAPAGMGGPFSPASGNGLAEAASGNGSAGPAPGPTTGDGSAGPAPGPATPSGQPAQNWAAATTGPNMSVNPAGGITISFQCNGVSWSVTVNRTG